MFRFVKNHIKRVLFREEEEYLAASIASYERRIATLSVADIVRMRLKGINPKTYDGLRSDGEGSIFEEIEKDGGTMEEFLKDIHDIAQNNSNRRVIEFLIREQVLFSVKRAVTQSESDFGKATINGLQVYEETIAMYDAMYLDSKATAQEYDEHTAL